MISIGQLNAMDGSEFVATLGAIFEHSPWVAERAAARRPFRSRLEVLNAMTGAVFAATPAEQLALIRAHPKLGLRAHGPDKLTPASAREQSRAGLTACTDSDFRRLEQLNAAYAAKFNFPFVLAVRGHNPGSVIGAIERRLAQDSSEEQRTALRQIGTIAGFRLADVLEPAIGEEIAAMAREVGWASAGPAAKGFAPVELSVMVREWLLAAGLTVWTEAGGYLLGQTGGGRPDARTMLLGVYLDPVSGALWTGDALNILVAIGVAQRLRAIGSALPVELTIIANPPIAELRDAGGLLDSTRAMRWEGVPDSAWAHEPGSALESALNEPAARASARILVRSRTASGSAGPPVDAAQAALTVQRLEQSFVAERAPI